MAQSLTEVTQSDSRSTGKIVNVVLWILQIGAAGMFLMVGFLKLSGDPQLVGLFEAIGLGQWFRYLTGTLEVAGALLLLIHTRTAVPTPRNSLANMRTEFIKGGVGHNLPQEAPQAFAKAVLDVDRY